MGQLLFGFKNLPRQIENVDDAKKLIKDFNAFVISSKKTINRVLSHLEPGEPVYFLQECVTKILNRETNEFTDFTAFIILTDRRLLIIRSISSEIADTVINIDEISSVESRVDWTDKISFRTKSLAIEFGTSAEGESIRKLFIFVVGDEPQTTNIDTTAKTDSTATVVASTKKSRVVVCSGCSATVFIRGDVSKCEYCGRYVE